MKLLNTLAAVTVLSLSLQHTATAEQNNGYAGMEEVLVVAKRLPAVTDQGMEEIVVTASRLPRPAAVDDFLATVAMGDFGQMAVRTPNL